MGARIIAEVRVCPDLISSEAGAAVCVGRTLLSDAFDFDLSYRERAFLVAVEQTDTPGEGQSQRRRTRVSDPHCLFGVIATTATLC